MTIKNQHHDAQPALDNTAKKVVAFPAGTSDLAAIIRVFDWSKTDLGPIAEWPPSLRMSVNLILQSPLPMAILWGDNGIILYNDGYAVVAGNRHPSILGSKVLDAWPEAVAFNQNVMTVGLRGETLSYSDQHFILHRVGVPEDAWLDLTYSPILDELGTPVGVIAIVVETTGRVLEERQRRQVEERFQLTLNAGAVIGMWMWDIPSDCVTADARFAKYFSIDPVQAAQGLPLAVMIASIHPEDRPRITAQIAQTVAAGGPYRAEYRVQHVDGSYRWIEANGHCELAEDGTPVRFPGILIDIDERKRIENALRDSEAELQLITNAMPEMIAYVDRTLTYRFVNRAYQDWFGRAHASIIGQTMLAVMGSKAYVSRQQALEQAFNGNAANFEGAVEMGEPQHTELRFVPRRTFDGAVQGIYIFVLDISYRKQAERALQQINEGLEQQVQQQTRERDRIWNVSQDLLGIAASDGTWLSVSPAWHRALGWFEEDFLGRTSEWMEHPDDRAKTRDEVTALAAGHTTMRFENRFRHKDGSYRWLSWTAVPNDGLLYCVARDVTVEKERQAEIEDIQEQLRQAQKMEAIGQLTGGIAHDFNNLLTGIVGNLDLLQRRLAANRLDGAERYITTATASAKRAAALTHRLLAFARRQALDVKPTDVNELIGSLEDLLHRTLGESIAFEMLLQHGLWVAMTDANQLENALLNLCINARDAMPDGGKLTVETANAVLDAIYTRMFSDVQAGEYIVISVSDTGSGMSPDVIARAFDPFFTTKPIGQGTGLGLSMIYGFVKQSDGHIRMYSEPGQGTTVKVYLPRHVGEFDTVSDVSERPRAEVGECVLVVEDDPAVRMVVVEVLHDLGYRALEAVDAPTALVQIDAQARIDLLVTDVGLPGMNGRQLAEIVRQKRPELPVLFVTGYAEGAAVKGGFLDLGMEMISKPFDIDVLATKIRTMIERE